MVNYSLEELEKEAEENRLTGKFEAILTVMDPEYYFLVNPESGISGILFKSIAKPIMRKIKQEDSNLFRKH